jgi:hypothetical protein
MFAIRWYAIYVLGIVSMQIERIACSCVVSLLVRKLPPQYLSLTEFEKNSEQGQHTIDRMDCKCAIALVIPPLMAGQFFWSLVELGEDIWLSI